MKKNSTLPLLLIILLLAGVAVYLFVGNRQQQEVIQELNEQFEMEKEELENDYSQLALQYESYGIRLDNDSLAQLLDQERTRNLRLMEEIKTLKINNARRLNELKKELETARVVMRSYVVQIDSLNTLNTRLKEENTTISRQYREAQAAVSELSQQNSKLNAQVQLARKLEARDISVRALTDKGRTANRIAKTTVIEFKAIISKNISAEVGEKPIYLRIMQPDDEPLLKADAPCCDFEGSRLECSVVRTIEYDGEEQPVTLYWQVEEFLNAGTYRADFFADGYQIGSTSFTLSN